MDQNHLLTLLDIADKLSDRENSIEESFGEIIEDQIKENIILLQQVIEKLN